MVRVEAAEEAGGWRCSVELVEGSRSSRYEVRVASGDLERWGRGEPPERLVERTFAFLLAREPAGSILSSFALSDVTRYFPEFDREMRS